MLLQQLIFPQKLSRRVAMVMVSERSGVACTSTGTFKPDRRMASTMPRSSPKLGSVTMMPSISSACFLKSSAQLLGLSVSFHCAVVRLFRAEHDGLRACGFKCCDDFFTAGLGQVMREKAAISYNNSKCHLALRCHDHCSFVAPAPGRL